MNPLIMAVVTVVVLVSLVGVTWNFVNVGDCAVKNATGGCGTGATWLNTTPYDTGTSAMLKLLPLFLIIGGVLVAVSWGKGKGYM